MDILEIKKNILFDEPSHTYRIKNGVHLTSVSKILSDYKNIFDPQGHIKRAVAKRDGLSVNQIQAKWDKERDDACVRGHSLHRQLEYFINTKKVLDDDYKDVVEQFSKIRFSGKLYSEVQLFSPSFKIAGTTDLVEILEDNTINLGDYKQNKKMLKKSKYGNKLLHPLQKYDECEYNIYCFQMNLYKFMLEEHGYKVNNMTLYYISPSTRILEILDVPHLERDTQNLLNHFRAVTDW